MKKIIILFLIFTSCGSSYNIATDYKIKSILTITEKGDTLAVPVRDFKFRILDRRIQEIINRDPFRYQYRQNWQGWNYNYYSIPNIQNKPNYSKPNPKPTIITPQGSKPTITIPLTKPIKSKKNNN